ncbi:MAG: DUF1127 domain-containing protein [Alphaproteobacteria bacterium]
MTLIRSFARPAGGQTIGGRTVLAAAGRLAATAMATVGLWRRRARDRRDLASLSDRDLRDIGIDRFTARREAAKPFWRA